MVLERVGDATGELTSTVLSCRPKKSAHDIAHNNVRQVLRFSQRCTRGFPSSGI